MKAIETIYKGYRFRSRLEARWAVFFDTLRVEWLYEHEGFELPSGRYLPDFYLPSLNLWVEIKGEGPTKHEVAKARELLDVGAGPVFISCGLPENYGQFIYYTPDIESEDDKSPAHVAEAILAVPRGSSSIFVVALLSPRDVARGRNIVLNRGLAFRNFMCTHERIRPAKASLTARSARFEFGEAGA